MEEEKIIFCKSGGCTAKLGAGVLEHILEKLPKGEKDPNLLVGYDSKDDASVYRLTDDLAMVQTLDFFPPVVEDPYTFGKIAAANALSDIYAMGGEVRTALNIVCFPEQMDLNVLGEIMRGGAEKVQEAGGSLSGGHSIADDSVKYGLSVTGTVHPDRIWQNNTGRVGDLLILTKPLGTGILCAAHRVGEENPGVNFMAKKAYWRHIYVWTGVWQSTGWSSVIYFAALAGISPELHEAAKVDGATKLQLIRHIDLPLIMPTATILLIMNCGSILSVGFEKAFLLQNNLNASVSEIISTYVYKVGLINNDMSYSSAIGLFNTIVNMVMLIIVNTISDKLSGNSLW